MTAASLPSATQTKKTSYLELFFDLVFVFAITQLAGTLHDDHTASGWGHAALLLWLVWWAWSQFTWAGNAIDLENRPTRIAMLAVTGLMLVAAVGIPDTFGTEAAWFAVPYAAVRFSGLAMYWFGLRGDQDHRRALLTYLPLASVSPLLVLLGGLLAQSTRPWIWTAAVLVDVASALLAGRGEFRIAPGHFAERHALIVIIALGESVIAVGITASGLAPSAELVMAVALGFAVIASMWWTYFDWVSREAEERLAEETDHRQRSSLARDLYTFGHLPIVAGSVVFAVAVEEVIAHPGESLPVFGLTAMAVGLVLFLIGFLFGNARAGSGLLTERLVAAVVIVLVVVGLGPHVSALALLAVLAALLVGTSTVETIRLRNVT